VAAVGEKLGRLAAAEGAVDGAPGGVSLGLWAAAQLPPWSAVAHPSTHPATLPRAAPATSCESAPAARGPGGRWGPPWLNRAETFVGSVGTIPSVGRKVQTLRLALSLRTQAGELSAATAAICVACTDLLSSARLRTVLRQTLAVGNALNALGGGGGGGRRAAGGFRLKELCRLHQTRAVGLVPQRATGVRPRQTQ
jgi:hypothetical protein